MKYPKSKRLRLFVLLRQQVSNFWPTLQQLSKGRIAAECLSSWESSKKPTCAMHEVASYFNEPCGCMTCKPDGSGVPRTFFNVSV
jgi:hypothetical protein